MKNFLIVFLLLLTSRVHADEFMQSRIAIKDEKLQMTLNSIASAVAAHDGNAVWSLGSKSWQSYLHDRGYRNLNDFRDDLLRTKKFEITYGEISRVEDREYAYFSMILYTWIPGRETTNSTHVVHIIFQKTESGWKFLNFPFRDFVLPFEASLMTQK